MYDLIASFIVVTKKGNHSKLDELKIIYKEWMGNRGFTDNSEIIISLLILTELVQPKQQ